MDEQGAQRGPELLRVGQLARRTGLTVRTLHHYDQIGLLFPARRTPSGHRLYGNAEVHRLQQIRSLRQLGFSLNEIAACLDEPEYSLAEVLRLHIEALDEQIEMQRRLRSRLKGLADQLASVGSVSMDGLIQTIEVTTMIDKHYTPEQLEYLEARRRSVGEDRIRAVQDEWANLFARFAAAREQGADPTDEPVLALARAARRLIAEFTGGDPGIQRSLTKMHHADPNTMYARWGVAPEVAEYMGNAMAALPEEEPA